MTTSKNSTMDKDALLNKADTPARRKYDELFNDSEDDDISFSDVECNLCSKSFSSVKAYEQHLNGKKHHQMLSKKKLMKKTGPAVEEENENLDPESNDELQCEVCEKTFSGYKPYTSHMKGGIHAKNVKQHKLRESLKDEPEVLAENGGGVESEDDDLLIKPFARCSACKKVFYDPTSYKNHMISSTHKKKMLQQKTLDSLKTKMQNDPQKEDEDFFTKCEVCNKQFSGPVPFNIHLKSGVHENQVKRVQAMEKLKNFFEIDPTSARMVCKECKKMFTDPFSFKQHLDTNSCEKKQVKDKVLEFVAANPEIVAMKSIENISSDEDNDEEVAYEKGNYFLMCKLCHMSFTGLESATDHVKSKKHVKAKDEKAKMKIIKRKMMDKKDKKDVVNGGKDKMKNDSTPSKNATDVPQKNTRHSDDPDDFELI